jgi:hypothetical protein
MFSGSRSRNRIQKTTSIKPIPQAMSPLINRLHTPVRIADAKRRVCQARQKPAVRMSGVTSAHALLSK